ncbi:MAG: zinc ribbon domain-containing protein [Candidatus Bipolaricaulaceae bacterium]
MSDELERLLALYRVDRAMDNLEGKLADLKGEVVRLRTRLEEEDQQFSRRQEEHRSLQRRATDKAAEVDETDARIRSYQKKLDQDIIAYKEMEHLRHQVGWLRDRLDQLEEEALQLMDAAEEDARNLEQAAAAHRQRRRRLEEEIDGVLRRQQELLAERDGLRARREEAAAEVPAHLRQHYDRLRESFSDPVAAAEDAACGGCHLRLSEITVERLREGRGVVTCENCSRFLYWRWR